MCVYLCLDNRERYGEILGNFETFHSEFGQVLDWKGCSNPEQVLRRCGICLSLDLGIPSEWLH